MFASRKGNDFLQLTIKVSTFFKDHTSPYRNELKNSRVNPERFLAVHRTLLSGFYADLQSCLNPAYPSRASFFAKKSYF